MIEIETVSKVEFHEVTEEIQNQIEAAGVKNGLCQICIPHTTEGIIATEHSDPGVVKDIGESLERLCA